MLVLINFFSQCVCGAIRIRMASMPMGKGVVTQG